MRLEWLEDILAVLETGSFVRAAEQRYLTQPAFSRRIKTIEDYVGVELFDRTKKPVQLKKSVFEQRANIQELVTGLRDLRHELKRQERDTHNHIVIASQHAITTSIAPAIVKKLSANKEISIRLRSFNRDECFASLISKQADLLLIYQLADEVLPSQKGFFEIYELGMERLIPVCALSELNRLKEEYTRGKLDAVVYPADVFFGQLLNQEVLPYINTEVFVRKKAETALTLAALKLALAGVGVAWLPQSLVAAELCSGSLVELSDMLPGCMLSTVAIRLSDLNSPAKDVVWEAVSSIAVHQV